MNGNLCMHYYFCMPSCDCEPSFARIKTIFIEEGVQNIYTRTTTNRQKCTWVSLVAYKLTRGSEGIDHGCVEIVPWTGNLKEIDGLAACLLFGNAFLIRFSVKVISLSCLILLKFNMHRNDQFHYRMEEKINN